MAPAHGSGGPRGLAHCRTSERTWLLVPDRGVRQRGRGLCGPAPGRDARRAARADPRPRARMAHLRAPRVVGKWSGGAASALRPRRGGAAGLHERAPLDAARQRPRPRLLSPRGLPRDRRGALRRGPRPLPSRVPPPPRRDYARSVTRFDTVRVAAIQATPVVLDGEASVDKAIRLLGEAADQGVQLAVLPETFVPLYPSNSWARQAASFGGFDELWERLWENSVDVPGPLVDRLSEACREHSIHCAIGVNERESERPGSIYNTLLLIGPQGLIWKHRKLMPTHHEKLFHGFGKGDDLQVSETPLGRIGGLICWENRMPLARYAVPRGGPPIL